MKLKNYIFSHIVAILLLPTVISAQEVAMNEDGSNPAQSAILDISSTDKGFLMPRMTSDEIASIDSPANGLIVYSTTDEKFYAYVLSEDIWKEIAYGAPPAWACGDALVDSRDSQSYTTVQIGTQCWMAENLNVGTRIDGSGNQTDNNTIEKYCYDDNTSNCDTYGGLYQWDEMMQYVTTESTQGICPTGWYLPSDTEWKTTEMFLGMSQAQADQTGYRGTDEGGKLKEAGTSHWNSPNSGATNSSGFTVLPAGMSSLGPFQNLGTIAELWVSNEAGTFAYMRALSNVETKIYRAWGTIKSAGYSVRCLRDSQAPEQASNPSPADASTDQAVNSTLSWTCSDPQSDPLTYDVYFGETNPPALVASEQSATTYDPSILNYSTTYYWKIVSHDDQSNSTEGVVWSFTIPAPPWACGDALVDSRDGQSYTTVQIGTQCWMDENLNVGTRIDGSGNQTDNSTIEKYCYDDNTSNCDVYGGLYQWDEMMEYSTTEGAQGICSTGWHLPTDDEYKTLEIHLGMTQSQADATGFRGTNEGSKLAGNEVLWIDGNLDSNPEFSISGFKGLPGGNRHQSGIFINSPLGSFFWTSNENGSNAWERYLYYTDSQVYRESFRSKDHGFSVRCVQN
ncbi:MAG: FISUMP domain-containing protein [Bacteroidota bacterium]